MQASLLLLLLAGQPSLSEIDAIPQGFLEFLGSMVEQDGEWVDPLSLRTDAVAAPLPSGQTNEAPDKVQHDDTDLVSEDGDPDE